MDERFKKSLDATRFLFLINVGVDLGLKDGKIHEVFGKFGEIAEIIQHSSVNAHVIFEHISSAIDAKNSLDNALIEELSCRSIGVRYCCPKNVNSLPATKFAVDPVGFDISKHLPGLIHFPDFVSKEEEMSLLQFIESQTWDDTTLSRRVQHYGIKFDYHTLLVSPHEKEIPDFFRPFLQRLVQQGVFPCEPNQITINEYLPGQGIASHVDTHSPFAYSICSLGLGSDCAMEFTPIEAPMNWVAPNPSEKEEYFSGMDRIPREGETGNSGKFGNSLVRFRQRVLMGFSDVVRFAFRHGIRSRKTDLFESVEYPEGIIVPRSTRVSITFRFVRSMPECSCPFFWACDHQNPQSLNVPTRLKK